MRGPFPFSARLAVLAILQLTFLDPISNCQAYNLTIVATREVRGHVLPVEGWDGDCPLEPTTGTDCVGENALTCFIAPPFCVTRSDGQPRCVPCSGGIAAMVAHAELVRRQVPSVLTVDPGNYYYGTEHYDAFKGSGVNAIIENAVFADDDDRSSELLYDVMGLGIADFQEGPSEYVKVMATSANQRVISNFDFSLDTVTSECTNKVGDPCFVDYFVTTKNGRKIGVLGATSSSLATVAYAGDMQIKDQGDVVASLTDSLARMQTAHPTVNIVILVSTLTPRENDAIALRVSGIDVIVANTVVEKNILDSNFVAAAVPEYPRILSGAVSREPVHIIHSNDLGRGVARLDLEFDAAGIVVSVNTETSAIDPLYARYNETDNWSPINNHEDVFDNYTLRAMARLEGDVIAGKSKVSGVITRKLFGHWSDGNDKAYLADYRGKGCRFSPRLLTEDATCPSSLPELPFLLQPQETPTQTACCPYNETESICADEKCEPTVDPITNTWAYPMSNGKTIDSCCSYNPFNNGASERGCCSMDWHWEAWGCRNSDCPLGRFHVDALMYACPDCDAVFSNGGGIRGSLGEDTPESSTNVTVGDWDRIFSFGNSFATFKIRQSVLVDVIASAAAKYQSYYGSGPLHTSGVRIVFHAGTKRLFRAEICSQWSRQTDSCTGAWSNAMDNPNRIVKVGTNNYIAEGNSGFTMLGANSGNVMDVNDYGAKLQSYMSAFLAVRSPYTPKSMAEIHEECGGYIHNYVEHWQLHPDCRRLKAAIEFPEKCPVSVLGQAECLTAAGPTVLLEGVTIQRDANSTCFECSGFGSCNTNQGYSCDCEKSLVQGFDFPRQYKLLDDASSQGAFSCSSNEENQGLVFMRGDSCEVPRARLPSSDGMFGYLGAFLCIAVSILSSIQSMQRAHSTEPGATLHQPKFTMVMNVGGVVGGIFCIFSTMEPSESTCNTIPLLGCLAIGLLLGGFLVKVQMVSQIVVMQRELHATSTGHIKPPVGNKNKKAPVVNDTGASSTVGSSSTRKKMAMRKMSNAEGFAAVGMVLVCEVVLCTQLSSIAPFLPTILEIDSSVAEWSFSVVCASRDEFGNDTLMLWLIAMLGLNLCLLLAARAFVPKLTARSRDWIPEAKQYGFMCYNIGAVTVSLVPMAVMFASNPAIQNLMRELAMTIIVVVTLLVLFVTNARTTKVDAL